MVGIFTSVCKKAILLFLFAFLLTGSNSVLFSQYDSWGLQFQGNFNGNPDSVIVQEENDDGGWFDSKKYYYTYHADGSVATEILYKYNYAAEEMRIEEKRVVTDPADKSIDGRYYYKWIRGVDEWRLREVNELKYDTDGNLIEATYGDFNNSSPNSVIKRQAQYVNGLLQSETKLSWNYTEKEWVEKENITIAYDDEGRVSEKLISNDEYKLYKNEVFTYNEDSMFVAVEKNEYNGTVNNYNYTIIYDEFGRISQVIGDVEERFVDEGTFAPATKEVRQYDENNRLIGKQFFKQQPESGEWKLAKELAVTFHTNGLVKDSIITSFNSISKQMEKQSVHQYESNGSLLKSIVVGNLSSKYIYKDVGKFEWQLVTEYLGYDTWIIDNLFYELWYDDPYVYSRDSSVAEYANGKTVFYDRYIWDNEAKKWVDDSYSVNNIDGDKTTYSSYEWDDETDDWVGDYKIVHEKTAVGSTEEYYTWDGNASMWELSPRSRTDSLQTVSNTDSVVSYGGLWFQHSVEAESYSLYCKSFDSKGNISTEKLYEREKQDDEWIIESNKRYIYYPLSSPVTGIDNAELDFQIYPTIASKQITVSNQSVNKDAVVYLYNSSGELLGSYKCNSAEVPISVTELPKGIYYVQLKSGSEVVGKPFVKN